MQAAFIRGYGGGDVLEVGDLPEPRPGPGDVLVRVRAAGVNPLDWKIRDGALRAIRSFRFPLVLGNELSGVVEAVGDGVTRVAPGDEVFGRVDKDRPGAFAELAVVRAEVLAPKPARLTHEEAAAIPLAGLTAWQALTERGGMKRGQRLLVHAGAGGVGSFAIQLGRILELRVTTTASPANHELVKELGAEVVIDYRSQRFDDLLRNQDMVLDTVGGETLARSFRVLRPGGVLVTIAGVPDGATMRELGAGFLMRTLGDLMNWRNHRAARAAGCRFGYLFMRPDGAQLERLAGFVEARRLRPVMDQVYPLAEARQALTRSASGHARGKIVLRIAES